MVVGGGGHLVYASTSARDPPRCVCGGWRVWACARKPVNVCVCVCVSASARAGDSTSAGCLCFSVRQFHFVLYDYVCVVMYRYAIAFVCEYNLCIPDFN